MKLVRRKGSKKLYLRVMVKGKRRLLSTGFPDYKRAHKAAGEMLTRLQEQARGWSPESMTVKQWFKRYRETYTVLKTSGKGCDMRVMAQMEPLWGDRQLSSISPHDCAVWKNKRLRTHKSNTVRLEQGLLSAIWGRAVDEGVIGRNPWRSLKRDLPLARTRVLTPEEQKALEKRLKDHQKLLLRAFLGTGLRQQEMAKLGPSDIKSDGLHVRGKRGQHRVVPLTESTREIFAVLLPWQRHPVRALYEKLQRLEVGVTLHDLRRTFGTRCATAGMPLPSLAKIMGHTDPKITMQYYVHVQQMDLQKAMDRVDLGIGERPVAKVVGINER